MKGTPLHTAPDQKHLGITIAEKLDWSPHCNTTASKANRTLGVLRRHLFRHYTRVVRSLSSRPRTRHWSDLRWSIALPSWTLTTSLTKLHSKSSKKSS